MKKILMITAACLCLSVPAGAADPAAGIPADITIKVNGMVCDFCARAVEKVFRKQDAVNDITVDLDKSEIVVDLKDGQNLDDDTINALVTDSGYAVEAISHAGK